MLSRGGFQNTHSRQDEKFDGYSHAVCRGSGTDSGFLGMDFVLHHFPNEHASTGAADRRAWNISSARAPRPTTWREFSGLPRSDSLSGLRAADGSAARSPTPASPEIRQPQEKIGLPWLPEREGRDSRRGKTPMKLVASPQAL